MADEQTDKNLETLNHELITLIRLGSLDKNMAAWTAPPTPCSTICRTTIR